MVNSGGKIQLFFILGFVLIFCASNFVHGSKNKVNIDETKTLVWGPGLNPENITLRARYIFLQLVNKDGTNVTESPGTNVISTEISGETKEGTPCQIWSQVFDCKDGSFIIRYRIYNTCFNINIIIKINRKVLPLKHSKFIGPVYEEECYCPNPLIESWLINNECKQNHSQIFQDLELFPVLDFDVLRNKMIAEYNKPNSVSICHYIIKSNKIYRKCYGKHIGFKSFSDNVLLSLTRKTILPDIEFFMNLGDRPLVPKNKENYPIISWCGSEESNDIVIPTYDITQSSIEAMASVLMDIMSVQGRTKLPWNKKIIKAFWRGRDARRERLDLIDIARKNPDLFNASITNFFFFRNEIEKYGPPQKHISFFDFFEYKFQINIDGTVAAYRFPYLLAGDSLVFKQKSNYYEFFYREVKDNKHFISVKRDLSDLVERINWAIENDDEAYKIAKQARQYVRNNLMPQNIFCYYVTLLNEYSKRIKSEIQVLPQMEEILQPEHECNCAIHGKGGKDEL